MKTPALAIFLVVLGGCGLDELVFTLSEQRQLEENLPVAIEASQALVDLAAGVAQGDPLPAGSAYVPPSAANDWTAQLDHVGDALRGASGTLHMEYRVLADGTPVDPEVFDFSGTQEVKAELFASFSGTSDDGLPLAVEFEGNLDITPGDGYGIVGTFRVDHNGYHYEIRTGGMRFNVDSEGRVVSVGGTAVGEVDIPNLSSLAGMALQGSNDAIEWAASVAGTWAQGAIPISVLG